MRYCDAITPHHWPAGGARMQHLKLLPIPEYVRDGRMSLVIMIV